MKSDSPQFADLTREEVLLNFNEINWDSYVHSGAFITAEEVEVLRNLQEDGIDNILPDKTLAAELVRVLMKVLRHITADSAPRQYALTRIEDILSGTTDLKSVKDSPDLESAGSSLAKSFDPSRHVPLFTTENGLIDDQPFLRVLRDGDSYSQRTAGMALARLLIVNKSPMEEFVNWLCEQLANSQKNNASMRAAVLALTILLRRNEARNLFGQHGGVGYLTKLLKNQGSGANAQLLYEITFCLWTLSFSTEVRGNFMEQGTIPVLCEQVTAAPREKVVRVSLAALRNLYEGEADTYNTAIIGCGLLKTLKNMRERQWADPDVAEDVEAVYKALMENYRELSTFERWAAEVQSKQLKWGLVHQEKFWRENAKELEANEFALLKELIELLRSEDPDVVSVACYDLGEFVRFYPNGKSIVKNLGAKDLVMSKIGAVEDDKKDEEKRNVERDPRLAEVQRQALQCMSKIMVNKWEFMH